VVHKPFALLIHRIEQFSQVVFERLPMDEGSIADIGKSMILPMSIYDCFANPACAQSSMGTYCD
jgi:hypothetical protein